MSVPQVGPWSTKVILCQHIKDIAVEHSLFALMETLKVRLDLTAIKMAHFCISLKVSVVLFLVHHMALVKKLPVLFARNKSIHFFDNQVFNNFVLMT